MPEVLNRRGISFRAQVETDGIRTESFLGRDWLVVPVIALVEGVLQGMNAAAPELALASEFARVPQGWDGRPIVMNHPILEGNAVSANIPKAYESYTFGMLFNTKLEDKKLKSEAWIDLERVEALGGEFQTTIERLQNGTTVEVSTGLWTDLELGQGRYNGKDYSGTWRNVVPDHLAFLSEGTIGACSIEDGCGTPRVNTLVVNESAQRWQECGCKHGGTTVPDNNSAPNTVPVVPAFNLDRLNQYPDNMQSADVRQLVASALNSVMSDSYVYVISFSKDQVVYETYEFDGGGYVTYQRSFDISDAKQVTLKDDIEKVVVTMEVTPAQPPVVTNATRPNSGDPVMPDTNPQQPAATTTPAAPAPEATVTPAVTPETPAPAVTTPATNAAPAPTPVAQPAPVPRVQTAAEYIANAPSEIRDILNEGMAMRAQKKASLIQVLKSTNRVPATFTDERLNSMDIPDLEGLVKLAGVTTNYAAANPGPSELSDNSTVPPMPKLIVPKTA